MVSPQERNLDVLTHESTCLHYREWIILFTSKEHVHDREPEAEVVALELKCPIHDVQWWFGRKAPGI